MTWTNVAKPTGAPYTHVDFQGKQRYDESTTLYDDTTVYYDTVNTVAWTDISKPSLPSAGILDSYSESNQDSGRSAYASQPYVGQSFTVATASVLDSAKFFLSKSGTITGTATAVVFAHSGVYGTSGVPVGSALATSDTFNVSALTGSYQLITFNFSGGNRVSLNSNTHYCIELNYSGGNASNYVLVGMDSSSPTAQGNSNYQFGGVFTADATVAACFYVYGKSSWTNLAKPT